MKQFINIYRAVSIVKKTTDDLDNTAPSPFQDDGFLTYVAITASAKRSFKEKYKGKSYADINYIFADAISAGYLQDSTSNLNNKSIDVVGVTRKGRKLLDFPFGSMQEFLNEYSGAVSFLFGGVTVATLWKLGEWLVRQISGLL